MITERMDESLILLAYLLCWPLEWVVHLDLNIRKPEKKVDRGQYLNDKDRLLLIDFLRLDMEIYKHFNRRFEEHLMRFNSDFGHHRMKDQLRLLKDAKNKLKQRCVIQQVGNDKLFGEFYDPSTNDIMGYAIDQYVLLCFSESILSNFFNKFILNRTLPECGPYAWSENYFLQYFRPEMLKRAHTNLLKDFINFERELL